MNTENTEELWLEGGGVRYVPTEDYVDSLEVRIEELEAVIKSHGIPVKTYAGGEAHYCWGDTCNAIAEELDQMAEGFMADDPLCSGKNVQYYGSHIRGVLRNRAKELRDE